MELRNAVFYSTDTLTASTSYRFTVKTIRVQVKKIWPLIFEKKILFDSLHFIDPDIVVTRLRAKDTAARNDTAMSLPQEMGKIYNSIQDGLRVLQVTRFQVQNGKFKLVNKTKPGEIPVAITNIDLRLDNLEVDTSSLATRDKILFSDNVELNTHHQNIFFPDGRHRLSFTNFHVNILNRVAEFDSCTISADKGDSASAAFSIFFDKLKMTNINFDTLYQRETIKADSVYCINPRFLLNVDLIKRTGEGKSPRLDEMVQQLMGDMQLAFVTVQNGSFDINATREGRPSSFTSDNNNFELQGLRIKKEAARQVMVDKFVMAIHNYENFLRDSTYAMQFDSILIKNDRISLSNFAYQELENNKVVNHLVMSQFELQGLSWDDLVFNQQLKAKNVTLFRPVINYDFTRSDRGKKNIFQTLGTIGSILQLHNLDIIDGRVNLLFKNNIRVQLETADIFVLGQRLTDAKKASSIRQSITGFNFKKGYFKMNDLTAELSDIQFTGTNNKLKAGNIRVKNKNDIDILADDVAIQSMIIDDDLQQVTVNGINWRKADIHLSSFQQKSKTLSGNFVLKQVKGDNTNITTDNGNRKLSVLLHTLSADEISSTNEKIQLEKLVTTGSDLTVSDSSFSLIIKDLQVADHQSSSFKNFLYASNTADDSIYINTPSINFTPDINSIINDKIYVDAVTLLKPVIKLRLNNSEGSEKKANLPDANINKLIILQPDLSFINTNDKGTAALTWKNNGDNNTFELTNVKINEANGFSADQLLFSINNFIYTNPKGRSFNAGDGKIIATVNDLKIHQNEINAWDWQGTVANLNATNFILESIDKKGGKLTITTAQLTDFAISSSSLLNLRDVVKQNTDFNLKEITGSYINDKDRLYWYNAGYNKKTKFFSTDSIYYRPAKERDAYITFQPYQSDYTTIRTGAINFGPFDIDRYIKDTVLALGVIKINNGSLTGFRDKRKSLQPGLIKALPVNSLKKFPAHLEADSVDLSNTKVEYIELNDKTNASGKIIVSNLNGYITNVNNHDYTETDSLYIQVSGLIQDSIFTRLTVKESYADPLGGFLMTGNMSPADVTVLNPVLIPLASVELKSGKLDTLYMQVTGNDDIAYGKMIMAYHDLKVKVYKVKNDKLQPTAGIITLLANLIVKNGNKDKINSVIFRRWKNRSPMNYIVKITMSGISSSVRFKKDRKELRRYKKEIKEFKLLPTPLG